MWPSLSTASRIADIANVGLIVSLIIGLISTVLIAWMSNVKEAYWERDRQESAERIAFLTKQSDELRKETAEANVRAAESNLALAQFKYPRYLSVEQ